MTRQRTTIVLLAGIGLALAALTLLAGALNHAATELRPEAAFQAPGSSGALLGRDQLGRDVLARVALGFRFTLLVGTAATILASAVGMIAGFGMAMVGGRFDRFLLNITATQMSLPPLLFLLIVLFTFEAGTLTTILALGANGWMVFARYYRSVALSLLNEEYVSASRGLGAGGPDVLVRHVLPGSIPLAVPLFIAEVGRLMLAESAITFLGFGIQPPNVSLGLVLAGGRDYLAVAPWITSSAGAGLFVAVAGVAVLSLAATRRSAA